MGKPITTNSGGICFAFPNVCLTQVGMATVPIPYPSIGQLADATSTAATVKAGGSQVMTKASRIPTTSGDSAGQAGVQSGTVSGPVAFKTASGTVFAGGDAVVRMFDQTDQNMAGSVANCVGVVLGGFPQVLVGD